ncbi:MAG: hypothetical protein Kow0029_09980 [Candidatus Rifleibacteriota bacterium]
MLDYVSKINLAGEVVNKLILAVICFLAISMTCSAQSVQRIALKDGTVIIGKVLEMKEGVYTINSSSVGKLFINSDNIIEIRNLTSADSEYENEKIENKPGTRSIEIRDGSPKNYRKSSAREKYERSISQRAKDSDSGSNNLDRQQEQVNSIVQSMTADGNFLNSLMDISQDQNMLDVMSDPEIMDAISRNDYDFLMNNEKMKNLMNSQGIKELLGEIEP